MRAAGTEMRCSRVARESLAGTWGDDGGLLGDIAACVVKYGLTDGVGGNAGVGIDTRVALGVYG